MTDAGAQEPGPGLPPPRAILFDWDNTLVDTWSVIHTALNAAQSAMGHTPWTFAETKTYVRASARDSFPRMFGERWEEALKIFYDTFQAAHLQYLREMPGAGDMLRTVAARGLFLAVVSNKQGTYLRREADHLGWTRHFGTLVGATDAPRDKPAIDPVEMALAGSGIARGAEVWFVGDADIDLLCAHNAGCVPVLMRPDAPAQGEFLDAPPAQYVPDCKALATLLTRI